MKLLIQVEIDEIETFYMNWVEDHIGSKAFCQRAFTWCLAPQHINKRYDFVIYIQRTFMIMYTIVIVDMAYYCKVSYQSKDIFFYWLKQYYSCTGKGALWNTKVLWRLCAFRISDIENECFYLTA